MLDEMSGLVLDVKGGPGATGVDTCDDFYMELPPDNTRTRFLQSASYFAVDEGLRRALAGEMQATFAVHDSDLPYRVHSYYALSPLETTDISAATAFITEQAIKAQSISDGRHHTLGRIAGLQPSAKPELGIVDRWKGVQSPGIARIHEAFVTRAFGDNSLVIVREYKPLATSLASRLAEWRAPASESFLWSIVLQLASALNAIHGAGLAAWLLCPSTVWITPAGRVYIACGGLADLLALCRGESLAAAQQRDLRSIGQLLSAILHAGAEGAAAAHGQLPLEAAVGPGFSARFRELAIYLSRQRTHVVTTDDIVRLAGSRALAELDAVRREADVLLGGLRLEMANGRLARLLCKMGFVSERAGGAGEPGWTETGDRYLVALFRDYVFHAVDENGVPATDMAHVIGNLNKLDAGSGEKVMLVSRDDKSCLVVSYSEIKRSIESAYGELLASAQVAARAWK
ncbi:PAB-dependent poly(A)-specific ribonuclease subunit 3 [Coemansia biformis]|uniref:PAB-dependent poly(A)-specific ribonuclease subunit 3 n=1 Tax=Coemansia biformis TaxID=1286918 RepID=A0A9W8D0Q2_9FUNG|nr:PAB-dependent poly(A)-specific ribonuclease subunit 3 [Coemansia biformis]